MRVSVTSLILAILVSGWVLIQSAFAFESAWGPSMGCFPGVGPYHRPSTPYGIPEHGPYVGYNPYGWAQPIYPYGPNDTNPYLPGSPNFIPPYQAINGRRGVPTRNTPSSGRTLPTGGPGIRAF